MITSPYPLTQTIQLVKCMMMVTMMMTTTVMMMMMVMIIKIIVPVPAMTAYRGSEEQLHSLLIWAVDTC